MNTLEREEIKELVKNLSELDENGRTLIESGVRLLVSRQRMEEQVKGGEKK